MYNKVDLSKVDMIQATESYLDTPIYDMGGGISLESLYDMTLDEIAMEGIGSFVSGKVQAIRKTLLSFARFIKEKVIKLINFILRRRSAKSDSTQSPQASSSDTTQAQSNPNETNVTNGVSMAEDQYISMGFLCLRTGNRMLHKVLRIPYNDNGNPSTNESVIKFDKLSKELVQTTKDLKTASSDRDAKRNQTIATNRLLKYNEVLTDIQTWIEKDCRGDQIAAILQANLTKVQVDPSSKEYARIAQLQEIKLSIISTFIKVATEFFSTCIPIMGRGVSQ